MMVVVKNEQTAKVCLFIFDERIPKKFFRGPGGGARCTAIRGIAAPFLCNYEYQTPGRMSRPGTIRRRLNTLFVPFFT
jgi:hypothetical protein